MGGVENDRTTSSFFLSQDSSNDRPPLKRRFPGPAGILPKLKREELSLVNSSPLPLFQEDSKVVSDKLVKESSHCSKLKKASMPNAKGNVNEVLLSKAPWKSMIQTLGLNSKDENDILNVLNIKWVLGKGRRFPGEVKIPFLAVVVQGELEVSSAKKNLRFKNPKAKLMDPTGTIIAAFNPSFVEAYGDKIVPGTALALRNCSLVKLKRQAILKVAKKNVLCLATTKSEDEEVDETTSGQEDKTKSKEEVMIMQTTPFSSEKILEEFKSISIKADAMKKQDYNSDVLSSTRGTAFNSSNISAGNSPSVTVTSPQISQTEGDQVTDTFADASFGFDDDDDEELLQALEFVDFVIEEDSM